MFPSQQPRWVRGCSLVVAVMALADLARILSPTCAAAPSVEGKSPAAMLYHPQLDTNRPGAVLMAWKAWSRSERPLRSVLLQWADRPNGTWYTIGDPTKMLGASSYSWWLPADAPAKVYLRLTVTDSAGRIAIAETSRPLRLPLPPVLPPA